MLVVFAAPWLPVVALQASSSPMTLAAAALLGTALSTSSFVWVLQRKSSRLQKVSRRAARTRQQRDRARAQRDALRAKNGRRTTASKKRSANGDSKAPKYLGLSPATLERRWRSGFHSAAEADLTKLARDHEVDFDTRSRAELALGKIRFLEGRPADCLEHLRVSRSIQPHLKETVALERDALEVDALGLLQRHEESREALLASALRKNYVDFRLRLANTALAETDPELDATVRLSIINSILAEAGVAPLARLDTKRPLLLDNLRPATALAPVEAGPCVSIVVAAFNAERWIATALRSIQDQTWQNLEVVIVDDASQDGTVEVAEAFVREDERFRLVRLKSQSGPYAARNLAMEGIRGDLITAHDADDWSHPQKIELQVRELAKRPGAVASQSMCVRVSNDLQFTSQPSSQSLRLARANLSSTLFPSTLVRRAGKWYSWPSADSEFRRRLQDMTGGEIVTALETAPLSFVRVHERSLTNGAASHYKSLSFVTGARRLNLDAAEALRHIGPSGDLVAQAKGPTDLPVLIPEKGRPPRHYDVIHFSDFALPGGTTHSNMAEIHAQSEGGLTSAVVHQRPYMWKQELGLNRKFWSFANDHQIDVLTADSVVSCDTLIVRNPPVASVLSDVLPAIRAKRVLAIVNQPPRRLYEPGEEILFDISQVDSNLKSRFSAPVTWYPISPVVRHRLFANHASDVVGVTFSGTDWVNIIDARNWRRPPHEVSPQAVRIGRHSRDADTKWPETAEAILGAYPDSDQVVVHVLGGDNAAMRLLGRRPSNWVVQDFDALPVKDFLSELDVYVYFTRSTWTEAFGRSVLEAMAVGVPVVTSPALRETFGDAAIYCEPHEVLNRVMELSNSPILYQAQVERAFNRCLEDFSYETHLQRLANLPG